MNSVVAAIRPLSPVQAYMEQAELWLAQQQPLEPEWLSRARREALQAFEQFGFPSRHLEQWKYTSLEPLTQQLFHRAERGSTFLEIDQLPIPEIAPYRLVLVNGFMDTRLSKLSGLPNGITWFNLRHVVRRRPEWLEPIIQQQLENVEDGIHAINIGLMSDGAFVRIEANCRLDAPLHIVHLSHARRPLANHSFSVVELRENSSVAIIESFHGLGEREYFTDSRSVIRLGRGAQLIHYKLQHEQPRAVHLCKHDVQLEADSRFDYFDLELGGRLARDELKVGLEGVNAACHLNGLFVANGKQHHDIHLDVLHRREQGISRAFYRGIADECARGVFDGRITVLPHAQKSDAAMSTKNLLLSADAEIDIKPQLKIHADDVKCSHGATAGQVDEAALFYCRSRGIDEASARALLSFAFIKEVLDGIPNIPIRELLQSETLSRLPHSEPIRETLWT